MSNFDQKNQKVNTQLNADKINIGLKPITCPNCQQGNPSSAKFCSDCGTSLMFKCPICNNETQLGAKFCSGCGNEISSIEQRVKIAQKMQGHSGTELTYKYKGIVINEFNLISHLMAESPTVRVSLDVDEYVIKEEDNVQLYKGNSRESEWQGKLFLTNKQLILLGYEPKHKIQDGALCYPFEEISEVEILNEKVLFINMTYLKIIYNSKLRKFSVTESSVSSWSELTKQYIQQAKLNRR